MWIGNLFQYSAVAKVIIYVQVLWCIGRHRVLFSQIESLLSKLFKTYFLSILLIKTVNVSMNSYKKVQDIHGF